MHTDSYLIRVRGHIEAGRRMRRVHTLTSPIGDRLRFQFEWAHAWWTANGEPDWSRFGATVTPESQWVWHESPSSGRTWLLPVTAE
ncbi:DUF6879 family protein [Nocardiopsis sp. NPDC049922]|uniref:DUF6879 family protein n=1 Tax=Nocardiopsis sp. NPDC049922 TaxID=3155157 RepID=UPI0033D40C3D